MYITRKFLGIFIHSTPYYLNFKKKYCVTTLESFKMYIHSGVQRACDIRKKYDYNVGNKMTGGILNIINYLKRINFQVDS